MTLKKVLKGASKEEVAMTLNSIADFNKVVMNYLKMKKL